MSPATTTKSLCLKPRSSRKPLLSTSSVALSVAKDIDVLSGALLFRSSAICCRVCIHSLRSAVGPEARRIRISLGQEQMGLVLWAERGEQLGNRDPCHSPSFSARNTKLRLLVTTSNFWSPMLETREIEETGMSRLE